MIGLHPRLRSRNSLLHLLERSRPDSSTPSFQTSSEQDVDDLPPLPHSPSNLPYFRQPYSPQSLYTPFTPATPFIPEVSEEQSQPKLTMAPANSKRSRQEAGEDQYGAIFSVSGPVVVAENMVGCAMYELVKVGHDQLVGQFSQQYIQRRLLY